MPAERIGNRYLVARRLGTGGMARVYLCWDERLEVWCAIKVMSAKTVADPILRARFGQEARTLARLVHPHLVRVFDLVYDVETPYMVMEYLEGGSLWHRVKRGGALHPWQAARVMAEVCEGLQLAHDEDVVHRDVKPQNLLMTADGTVKLGDFGVARVEQAFRLTLSNMALGTLAYMAPEQQRDAARVDRRADIYSAGATLYALSTGRRPTALMGAERQVAISTQVPTVLQQVVRRTVAPDPDERFQSAGELAAALRELCRDADAPADLPPLVDRPTPPPPEPPSDPSAELAADELAGTRNLYEDVDRTLGHTHTDLSPLSEDDPTALGSTEGFDDDAGSGWLEVPDQLPDIHDAPTHNLPPGFEPGAAFDGAETVRLSGASPDGAETVRLTGGDAAVVDEPPRRSRWPIFALMTVLILGCAGCAGLSLIGGLGGIAGAWFGM